MVAQRCVEHPTFLPFSARFSVPFCLLVFSLQVFSQENPRRFQTAYNDTIKHMPAPLDSTIHATAGRDSAKAISGRLIKPVFESGAITHEPSYMISDSEIRWSDYTYSGKILQKIPGSYLADMSQPGDPSELYFDGLGSDYVKYLLDGVELNEPTTSSFNLYHIPMEFVSNVQYLDALRAPIYQFNATGGLINFQTPLYSEPQPYSNVRHLEGPYNYLITDGVFSQNVGFKSNIDAGFEHQTTDQRFQNSLYDGVNIRAKYRYSIDSTQQLTIMEMYYRTKGGMNGGDLPYNVGSDIFNQFGGTPPLRSASADLTYLQHHLQAAYSQSSPHDSTDFLTASAFFDYYNFQFGDASIPYSVTNISRRFGASLRGSEKWVYGQLSFGGEAIREENPYNTYVIIPPSSRLSGYADEEFTLFDFVDANIFGRADFINSSNEDRFYPAFGALTGIGNEMFELKAGAGVSHHVPSLSEKYLVTEDFVGNPNLKAETDKAVEIMASFKSGENFQFSLKPYLKLIDDPIFFQAEYNGQPEYPQINDTNLTSRKILGLDATMEITLWEFAADGNLNYVDDRLEGNQTYTMPKVSASGELYFHDTLFTGHLNLKVGIRGQFESSFEGNEFYPAALVYYPGSLNSFGPFGSSDFFLQAKIGEAIIYFTLYNLTNQEYLLAPIYPALGTSFAFGINWEFLN